MDTIFIADLRIETRIGVYDWEKHAPQALQLDLEVGLPEQHGAESDRLEDTIDYAGIVTRVERLFRERRFSLLEHAAEAIASTIRDEFSAPWVKVSIAKLAPLRNVKRLGVTIERGSRSPQPRG